MRYYIIFIHLLVELMTKGYHDVILNNTLVHVLSV